MGLQILDLLLPAHCRMIAFLPKMRDLHTAVHPELMTGARRHLEEWIVLCSPISKDKERERAFEFGLARPKMQNAIDQFAVCVCNCPIVHIALNIVLMDGEDTAADEIEDSVLLLNVLKDGAVNETPAHPGGFDGDDLAGGEVGDAFVTIFGLELGVRFECFVALGVQTGDKGFTGIQQAAQGPNFVHIVGIQPAQPFDVRF